MPTTSLLSLLMSDSSVDLPDSCDPVGNKLSLSNVSGSLACDAYERRYGNSSLPNEIKLSAARQEQVEPPPYSYSPDAYDTEIYGSGTCTARIEVDEPPLDAHSPDSCPIATPTICNKRSSTRHPDWTGWYGGRRSSGVQQQHLIGSVISPIDLAGSPLTSSSISALEREYDRDTWRLFHRIQLARSLQQQQQQQAVKQQEPHGLVATRLQLDQRMVSAEGLEGEEFDDDEQQRARIATDEEDEEIMFAMD